MRDNISKLPDARTYEYKRIRYNIQQRDNDFRWRFLAREFNLPVGELPIYGTASTLSQAHTECRERIDSILATIEDAHVSSR